MDLWAWVITIGWGLVLFWIGPFIIFAEEDETREEKRNESLRIRRP